MRDPDAKVALPADPKQIPPRSSVTTILRSLLACPWFRDNQTPPLSAALVTASEVALVD